MTHRSLRWIGHVLRMDNTRLYKPALTWHSEGKKGRPETTWRRTNKHGFHFRVSARIAATEKTQLELTLSRPYLKIGGNFLIYLLS